MRVSYRQVGWLAPIACVCGLLLNLEARSARAQTPVANSDAHVSGDSLQHLWFYLDTEAAARAAASLIKKYPNDERIAGLHLLLHENQDVAAAKTLLAHYPAGFWSHLALAHAYYDNAETQTALRVVEKGLALYPRSELLLKEKIRILRDTRNVAHVTSFADTALSIRPDAARLIVEKALALVLANDGRMDPQSYSLLLRAESLAPDDPHAFVVHAGKVLADSGCVAATPLIRRSLTLSPFNQSMLQSKWRCLSRSAPDSARVSIQNTIASRPNYPRLLAAAATAYQSDLRDAKTAEAIRENILSAFPESPTARDVRLDRLDLAIGSLRSSPAPTDLPRLRSIASAARSELGAGFDDRVDWILIMVGLSDTTAAGTQQLVAVANDIMGKRLDPGGLVKLFLGLADRRAGLGVARKLVMYHDSILRRSAGSGYVNDFARHRFADLAAASAVRLDGLGWIDVNAGDLRTGEAELRQSLEIDPRNALTHYHLGRALEMKGLKAEAISSFTTGLTFETSHSTDNASALGRLLGSFDEKELKAKVLERRRQDIVAAVVRQTNVMPFTLKDRSGHVVTSDSLFGGKISVVNLWGTWCSPCVTETPEIEAFYNRIKADTTIRFTTISTRDNAAALHKFMTDRGFTFPVLLDPESLSPIARGTLLYPTTYFVDENGHVIYEANIRIQDLVEEWTWRIDAMRQRTKAANPGH